MGSLFSIMSLSQTGLEAPAQPQPAIKPIAAAARFNHNPVVETGSIH